MYSNWYEASAGGEPLEDTHWSGGLYSPKFDRTDRFPVKPGTTPPYGPTSVPIGQLSEKLYSDYPIFQTTYNELPKEKPEHPWDIGSLFKSKKNSNIEYFTNFRNKDLLTWFLIILLAYMVYLIVDDYLRKLSKEQILMIIIVIVFIIIVYNKT